MVNTLKEAHKIYKELNKQIFNNKLPKNIVISLGTKDKSSKKEYWLLNDEKLFQIDISVKSFMKGEEDFMVSILLAMIHLLCKQEGIKDTDKNGDTEDFIMKCQEFGLEGSLPSEELEGKLKDISFDKSIFNLKPIKEPSEKGASKRKPKFRYICNGCNKKITSDIEDLKVKCKDCDLDFVEV